MIDAGGRNVTISLRSRSGHTSISAAVGLTLFCQGWYWYPYHHMLSLAFMPTAVVGLDASLAMPKFSFASNAPPSRYAYPDPTKPPEKKVAAKVEKAVLSTAKRSAANAAAKQDAEEGGDGDVADMDATPTTGDEPMPDAEADGDADEAAAEEAAAEPEVNAFVCLVVCLLLPEMCAIGWSLWVVFVLHPLKSFPCPLFLFYLLPGDL